ncbi:ParA family protein [Olsenella uli]|uniref:ParA family protein n=1 Tax=Olsenella uli TaxID=133926 RepID=UPI0028F029D6|nr:ParA family protein [Olsenella uli]
MKNIVVCNQKGGVGKSLVADELAFSLERSKLSTSFYDLDGQGGTLHETKEVESAETSVVDTPGALQRELADWLSAADAIVVPTRPTSRDIAPLMRMRDAILARADLARTILIVNGWNRFRASRDFMDWLKGTDFTCVVRIPQSELFVQAGAAGISVVDFAPRSKAARAVLEMCYAVRHVAGLPQE